MGIRTCAAAGVLATGLLVLSAGPAAAAIDLECGDFPDQASAQVVLESNPDDPNGLDADADGWACEDFDYATGGAQVTTAPAGGVATGDGSTASPDTPVLPFVAGGLGLVAAGAAGLAARRSARGSA